ncbi:DNA primase TraC [compost metagenome]
MPRIDLTVPFAEKNEAKRLGARWDAERKLWYVPDGLDAGVFKCWLPSEPDISVRSRETPEKSRPIC